MDEMDVLERIFLCRFERGIITHEQYVSLCRKYGMRTLSLETVAQSAGPQNRDHRLAASNIVRAG